MADKTDIWMPLYIRDYIADTMHLSTEEHGAYLLLLMHYWINGPIPDNDNYFASVTRLSNESWLKYKSAILAFFIFENGFWKQKRSESEKYLAMTNRTRATKAARVRWNKAETGANPDAQTMLEGCTSPSPSPSPIKPISSCEALLVAKSDKLVVKDIRHKIFREKISDYWNSKNKNQVPWNGSEAKKLTLFLEANPDMDLEEFSNLLRNRYLSEVNHSERPRVWIESMNRYGQGPIDKYGQPKLNRTLTNRQTLIATGEQIRREIRHSDKVLGRVRNNLEQGNNSTIDSSMVEVRRKILSSGN